MTVTTELESFSLDQDIFTSTHPPIQVVSTRLPRLQKKTVLAFLSTTTLTGHLGVSAAHGFDGTLEFLAFSTKTHVLLLRVPRNKQSIPARKNVLIQNLILSDSSRQKSAFRMDGVAAALYFDLSLRITSGVDLLSASQASRWSLEGLMQALGGEAHVHKQNLLPLLDRDRNVRRPLEYAVLEAWLACHALDRAEMAPKFDQIPRINTDSLAETVNISNHSCAHTYGLLLASICHIDGIPSCRTCRRHETHQSEE